MKTILIADDNADNLYRKITPIFEKGRKVRYILRISEYITGHRKTWGQKQETLSN